jgi:hypothetical protein
LLPIKAHVLTMLSKALRKNKSSKLSKTLGSILILILITVNFSGSVTGKKVFCSLDGKVINVVVSFHN